MSWDNNKDGKITIKESIHFIITEIFRGNIIMIVATSIFFYYFVYPVFLWAKSEMKGLQDTSAYIVMDNAEIKDKLQALEDKLAHLNSRKSGTIGKTEY